MTPKRGSADPLRLRIRHARPHVRPGAPPGTLTPPSPDEPVQPTQIRVIWYDQDHVEECQLTDVAGCSTFAGRLGTTWIDVTGVGDPTVLRELGKMYGLHPLALEDVQNLRERPKIETYEGQKFVVFRLARLDSTVMMEQISAFLVGQTLITFQEDPVDPWEPVRSSIRSGIGRVRSAGADYLLYSLIDLALDEVFPLLEQLGDRVDDLEQAVVDKPGPETLNGIFALKRELLILRKTVWPEREVILGLQQDQSGLIAQDTRLYLRDAYDHAVQLMDMLEMYRDLASNLLDAYLSSLSNRLNDIMKTLTIISTIFVPLTFVVGLYGMNFKYFPEIGWRFGYLFVWVIIVAIVAVLLRYFRTRHWF
ncbi:MAG: magnesium/cobalt transporter CorA [Caldisericota bacterium]|jgi:magnesium transporter|nr:magnesium/cobalt transporter CorA [Caldisericota bacterium]